METYLGRVKRWNKEQVESTKSRLADLANTAIVREKIAGALDVATMDRKTDRDWVGLNFELRFDSITDAREVTNKLIELLEVDKAEKNFDGHRSTPVWCYEINYCEQTIKIWPAEPSENCTPVARALTSTYWVCEKKVIE